MFMTYEVTVLMINVILLKMFHQVTLNMHCGKLFLNYCND